MTTAVALADPVARRRASVDGHPDDHGKADMALFLDRHDAPGATASNIAAAHELDLSVQDKYGVRYVTYWFDEDQGAVFCLAEGPDRESLEAVHREAHGLVADRIIEVGEGPVSAFLGPLPQHPPGEAYVDSAVRAIVFTDLCDSTRQTQELGDEGFMTVLHEHDEIVRGASVRAGWTRSEAHRRRAYGLLHLGVGRHRVRNRHPTFVATAERGGSCDPLMFASVSASVSRLPSLAISSERRFSCRPDCARSPPVGASPYRVRRGTCAWAKRFEFNSMGAFDLKGFPDPVPAFEVQIPSV